MGLKIPGHNTVRIKVEFPGETPPSHARVGLLENTVHRVINPRRDNVATFHDLPAGSTHAVVTVAGRSVAKKKIVVPSSGEVAVTLRARGEDDGSDAPYTGRFTVLDEHTNQPLRGRKYRITSKGGVDVTGETDADGRTRVVGTDKPETLHLELLDDELGHVHPDDEPDDDEDDDDEDDDAPGADLEDADADGED